MATTTKDEIRRRALLAAASVVLASCAGPGTPVGPSDEGAPDDLADSGAVLETDPPVIPADTDAAVETDAPADTGGRPDCTSVPEEAWFTCCEELGAWCAEQHPDDHEAVGECTFGPGYDGSTGCIPWGPPVPPAARGLA